MASSGNFERIVQKLAVLLILAIAAGAAYTLWSGANPWTVATIWIALSALGALCGLKASWPRSLRGGKPWE